MGGKKKIFGIKFKNYSGFDEFECFIFEQLVHNDDIDK